MGYIYTPYYIYHILYIYIYIYILLYNKKYYNWDYPSLRKTHKQR